MFKLWSVTLRALAESSDVQGQSDLFREVLLPTAVTYPAEVTQVLPPTEIPRHHLVFLCLSRGSGDWGVDGFEFGGTRESFVFKNHGDSQRKGGHSSECHAGKSPLEGPDF